MNNDLVILSKSEIEKFIAREEFHLDNTDVAVDKVIFVNDLCELLNKAQVVNGEAVAIVRINKLEHGYEYGLSLICGSFSSAEQCDKWIKNNFKSAGEYSLYLTPQPAIPEEQLRRLQWCNGISDERIESDLNQGVTGKNQLDAYDELDRNRKPAIPEGFQIVEVDKFYKLIKQLQRFSFLNIRGGVSKCVDASGNWIDYYQVINLIEAMLEASKKEGV